MNLREKYDYIVNNKEYIERYMAICEEESRTRKLKKFLEQEDTMTNYEICDAIIHLHDIARIVEKKIGAGKLSEDIRDCAERLNKCGKTI